MQLTDWRACGLRKRPASRGSLADTKNIPPDSIWTHIAVADARDLSDEEDRLNVLLGIFSHYTEMGVLEGHLYGMPIPTKSPSTKGLQASSFTQRFLKELCRGRCSAERCERSPSWSWMGWTPTQSLNLKHHISTCHVRLWIELVNGRIIKGDDYDTGVHSASRFIHLEAPVISTSLEGDYRHDWHSMRLHGHKVEWITPFYEALWKRPNYHWDCIILPVQKKANADTSFIVLMTSRLLRHSEIEGMCLIRGSHDYRTELVLEKHSSLFESFESIYQTPWRPTSWKLYSEKRTIRLG